MHGLTFKTNKIKQNHTDYTVNLYLYSREALSTLWDNCIFQCSPVQSYSTFRGLRTLSDCHHHYHPGWTQPTTKRLHRVWAQSSNIGRFKSRVFMWRKYLFLYGCSLQMENRCILDCFEEPVVSERWRKAKITLSFGENRIWGRRR